MPHIRDTSAPNKRPAAAILQPTTVLDKSVQTIIQNNQHLYVRESKLSYKNSVIKKKKTYISGD
jgi:hypothetical protein